MKLGSLTILLPAAAGIIALTNTLILNSKVDRSLLDDKFFYLQLGCVKLSR